ncbi:MAG: hypothetical protein E7312_03735 [Clostridiales bacterium]|nr:hypothetical protein [Clostridiales bacterium]
MFKVGQLIVYGNRGIYRVDKVGIPEIEWLKPQTEYYTLLPVFKEDKIYIPVDTSVYMRPVMSKDEMIGLMKGLYAPNGFDTAESRNPRSQEAIYKSEIESHDVKRILGLIGVLWEKRRSFDQKGKRLSQIDEKYLTIAENIFYEEVAVVFDVTLDEAPDIVKRVILE